MKCKKIQWRHAVEPFPVDKNEKIAKLVFQIITNEEPTDEMLDKMEQVLVADDILYYPLRVFTKAGRHLFCFLEIDLKNNTTTKEAYVETATEKLNKFGNVIECVYEGGV